MEKVIPSLDWQAQTGCIRLPSELTVANLNLWLKQHKALQLPVKVVDFGDNQKMDSSVLALLTHWAMSRQEPLIVLNASQQVHTLIDLYDLADLIHLN